MRNSNEAVSDTAITLFINSDSSADSWWKKKHNIIGTQLIDFVQYRALEDELLINSDNNVLSMEVSERPNKIKSLSYSSYNTCFLKQPVSSV